MRYWYSEELDRYEISVEGDGKIYTLPAHYKEISREEWEEAMHRLKD